MRMRSALLVLLAAGVAPGGEYEDQIERWRRDRELRLQADRGWLSVDGLYWLRPGGNSAGADPSSAIVLPAGAPPRLGVFTLAGGLVGFQAQPGIAVYSQGQPVSETPLRPDTSGEPTRLTHGPFEMIIIQRGERLGLRLYHGNAERRKTFTGLRWYPIDRAARVTARFVAYPPGRTVQVPNVLGTVEALPCPGYAEFVWQGTTVRLEPVQEGQELFFVFRDGTAPRETYPGGRFLYAELARDGRLTLDFNKAYNPPCAFTPYATCPLPPRRNYLKVAIRAGELRYHGMAGLLP